MPCLERFGHLGPAKLYLLAPLQPGERRQLTSRTPIPIPGGDPKTIDEMTHAEIEPELAQEVHDPLIELAAEISEAFGI